MSQRETGLIKTVFNTDNLVMRISEKIADLVTVNCGALPSDLGRMPSKSSDCIRSVFPMVLRYGGSLVASSYGFCDFCLKLSTRTHGLLLDWFF